MSDQHARDIVETTRIGNLLKISGSVTEEQLASALEKQKTSKKAYLGAILKNENVLDEAGLNLHLRQQNLLRNIYKEASEAWIHAVTRLGHILVDLDMVKRDQVDQAIEKQKDSGKPLGEILVDEGHLSIAHLHEAIKHQSLLRNVLLGALVSLVTASATLPYFAEAASSSATASITITLRILPKPLVELTEPPTDDGGGVLTLHGAQFTQDSEGNYFVTPLNNAPSGQPQGSVAVSLDQFSNQEGGSMNIYVTPN